MSILPELKRCPCCESINLVRVNGITEDNPFKNLKHWKLKKRFDCRKCKEELGLFSNNSITKKETKMVWLNNLNIEEQYYYILNLLKKRKSKLAKVQDKKYFDTLKDIEDIENKIRMDKIKLKIKLKIKKKVIFT